MTFSTAFIYQKLHTIEEYRKELAELLKKTSDEDFFSNSEKLHVAERLVQLIVDGMIDINQHFIRELKLEISDDLQGTFAAMGGSKILPQEFAEKVAPVVGVRNILVHQYENLDKKVFIKNLRKHFSDFEKYRQYVIAYLKKHP